MSSKCSLTFSLEFPSASVPKKKLMANHPPRWTRQKWKLPRKKSLKKYYVIVEESMCAESNFSC